MLCSDSAFAGVSIFFFRNVFISFLVPSNDRVRHIRMFLVFIKIVNREMTSLKNSGDCAQIARFFTSLVGKNNFYHRGQPHSTAITVTSDGVRSDIHVSLFRESTRYPHSNTPRNKTKKRKREKTNNQKFRSSFNLVLFRILDMWPTDNYRETRNFYNVNETRTECIINIIRIHVSRYLSHRLYLTLIDLD